MEAAAFGHALYNDLKFKSVFMLPPMTTGAGARSLRSARRWNRSARKPWARNLDPAATDFYTLPDKDASREADLVFLAYTQSAATALKQARTRHPVEFFGIGAVTTPTSSSWPVTRPTDPGRRRLYSLCARQENEKFVAAYKGQRDAQQILRCSALTPRMWWRRRSSARAPPIRKRSRALKATDGEAYRPRPFQRQGQGYGFSLYLVELTPNGAVVRASKEIDKAAAE